MDENGLICVYECGMIGAVIGQHNEINLLG